MRFSVARKRQPLWQLRRNIWCALLLFSSLNSTLRASAISSTDTLTYPNACQRNLCFLCMRVGVCVAGDQCTYKECDTGFELSDSGTAGARECELVGSSGRWSGSARTCDGEMRTILGGGQLGHRHTHTHIHTYTHTHRRTCTGTSNACTSSLLLLVLNLQPLRYQRVSAEHPQLRVPGGVCQH